MQPSLKKFLDQLCGEFSNLEQALDNPPFFAHIFIRYCTRTIRYAFLSNITFSNSTPIAKPIRTGNPVQRIMAFD